MSKLPLVTIVTPSYNQGQFLERTIVSILSQDYPNIEYIVMDGGSTDNSVEIIHKYESKLAYWVSEKDKGQSDAINKGWRRANGKYCAYLNSDDELCLGAVSKIVKTFLENPDAGMVYGDYTFVDEENCVIEEGRGKQSSFRKLLVDGQMPSIAQPSSFYLTSLVKQVGYIDESLHLSMDYDLLLKLAQRSRIVYMPGQVSLFRLHGNAKSSTLMEKHWRETLRVKAKYKWIFMTKAVFHYFRFRIFHLLPRSFQNIFRRNRNSINDKLILGTKNDQL